MQIIFGHGDLCAVLPVGSEIPVSHAVRMLHPHKAVAADIRHAEVCRQSVALCLHGHRLIYAVDIIVGEHTHADGGAGRGRDSNAKDCGDLGSEVQRTFIRCFAAGFFDGDGIIARRLIPHRGQGGFHRVALNKNAGGADGAPVSGGARLGIAVHTVGADHLVVDGVVGVLDPAAVGGIDLIDPLEGDGSGVRRHGDDDAAVILAGFIVALNPVVAGRQLHIGILQFVAISHGGLAGQQIHAALDAVGIGIQLQGCQLGAVQARQIHGGHGDLLDLGRGVEQDVNLLVLIAHSGEIAGEAVGHGEGGLALFIGNSAVNNGHIAGLGIHPAQLGPLQGLGRGLEGSGILIQVTAHGIETGNGSGDRLAHLHFGGCVHPGVIIGIAILVAHDIEVHHVAAEQRGLGDHGAVVAAARGRGGAVVGIAAVDIVAAGVGGSAEDLGDPAGAAHNQILPGGGLGKGLAENQLVGLDQRVQSGNALHLVGEAVSFCVNAGYLHLLGCVEIAARCLRADGDLHKGGSRLLHSDGILLGLFDALIHTRPGGIAALHGDHNAVRYGDLRRALIYRVAHAGADLEILVAGGGRHHHAADLGGQLQRVAVGVLIEGGRQLAGAEGQGLDGVVIVAPAAAQVIAIGAGVHDADLVAALQLAGRHGKCGEAFVGEPVVQGSHPAGHKAAVKLRQAVDLADVIAFSAGLGVALGFQRLGDTAHHGGILGELHPGIHQRAGPGRSFTIHRFCEGSVFHDDMGLAQVNGRCQHGGGHQGQGHHQCQQQG